MVAWRFVTLMANTASGLTLAGFLAWLAAAFPPSRPGVLAPLALDTGVHGRVCGNRGTEAREPAFLADDRARFRLGVRRRVVALRAARPPRAIGAVWATAILALAGIGAIDVVRQGLRPPLSDRVDAVLAKIARPEQERILCADAGLVTLPHSTAAADAEWARHERLAKKYNVILPRRAEEHTSASLNPTPGYYVRGMPLVFGGMEDVDPAVAEKVVKAFIWPPQPEELTLDYWTSQGFTIFVVARKKPCSAATTLPSVTSTSRSKTVASSSPTCRPTGHFSLNRTQKSTGSVTTRPRRPLRLRQHSPSAATAARSEKNEPRQSHKESPP